MTLSPRRGRLWAALLLVLTSVAWLAPAALADPPPTADAGMADAKPVGTPPTALTTEDVEDLLLQHPETLWLLILLKFVPGLLGVMLFVLELNRGLDVRRGLLPPPPPVPSWRRPAPADLIVAVACLGLLLVGPVLLLKLGFQVLGEEVAGSLGFRIGATAAATLPIAVWVAAQRRRARRQALAGEPSTLDYVLGPQGTAGTAPMPARGGVVKDALRTFCVATAAALVVGLAAKFALRPLGVPFGNQELVLRMVWPHARYEPMLIAAYGVLVAPWVEECIFRGMLQPALAKRFGRSAGVWGSSLIFAAFHLQHMPQDLYAFFPLVALAFFLARLKDRTESIFATTLVHALNNFTTLVPLSLLRVG